MYRRDKINIKIFVFIFWAIIISSALWFGRALAFNNTITHPALTENIVKVYNANFESKLSNQEIEWIKQGSVDEDNFPRPANHFFEPNSGFGIAGFANSKSWAQSGSLQKLSATGDYSWQTALSAYVKGGKKEAFIALGHVLHLLEDKAVPAHTRLDEHMTEGDPYEKWAESKKEINFNIAPIIISQLNEAFDGLALYSNKYFLSKDTINKEFFIDKNIIGRKAGDGKSLNCIEGKDNTGKSFCLILIEGSYFNRFYFIDDPVVHSDYFSLLAPKAVAYGVGVVNLFIQEGEKQIEIEKNKSWWQKIKDSFSASVNSSLMTGLPLSVVEGIVPAPASQSAQAKVAEERPVESSPVALPLNAVEAREKIAVSLPNNTVEAEEKLGGQIQEEENPKEAQVPPEINEEANPDQAVLPTPSATPTPSLSPSPSPTATPSSSGSSSTSSSTSSGSDATAPETTITSSPAVAVATTTAVFIFESSEEGSSFMCSLDNATSTACESPKEYLDLIEGSHSLKVSAKDAAGNEDASPAEYNWSVDSISPSLTNISSLPTRTAVTISWTSSEAGIFQAEYGTTTSYGLLSATTTTSNLSLSSLDFGTTYHFRILAEDNAGNATTSDDHIFVTSSQAENVVISEIQISGATATDEFVELYNPTSSDINLMGWKLARRLANATTSYDNLLTSFPDRIIPAKGYFLIAHPTGYDGGVPVDTVYSSVDYSITPNNAVILYSDRGETIVDMVGLGTALSSETATIDSPLDNKSIERKSYYTSTDALLYSGEHKWQGNGYDSNNNSVDFVLQNNPGPQNSLMLTEPRTSWPVLASSVWPTWQGNFFRNGQSNAVALATSTMAIKWMATTTVTQSFNSRPVFDGEGNIYIGRADGLAKYSPSGSLVWLYGAGAIYTTPLIASDGTIYFRGSGALFAVNREGKLKWKYFLDGTISSNASLAFGLSGEIITQGGQKIFAVNQDATLKWSLDLGREVLTSSGASGLIIDSSGNIFMAMDKYVYAVSSNGQPLWEKTDLGWCSAMSLSDNVLYLTVGTNSTNGGVYALNSADGSVLWSNYNGFNNQPYLAPAEDSAGNIYELIYYFGAYHLELYSATATSTPVWSASVNSPYLASPIITSDGKIYLADDKAIKTFDAADGALLGSFSVPDNRPLYNYFGAVGADGVIYTANSLTLYAIDD